MGGESAAHARLHDYLWRRNGAETYKKTRNGLLGANFSTRVSPWLLGGCRSAPFYRRECVGMVGARCLAGNGNLRVYSAVILSFLGGVHWGSALQVPRPGNTRRLLLAMVPSLIAWPALLFDVVTGLWVLLAGFIVIGGYDLSHEGREGFPSWYFKLRGLLSVVVVLLHLVVLLRLSG